MYLEYYRLREAPFNITPDPRFLYFSPRHQEAFNHLLFGVHQRKGFIMLTGDVGAGKTTVCRKFLEQLDARYRTALILNPCISGTMLLRAIVTELGIPVAGRDRLSYLEALNQYVLDQVNRGNDVVLIIDEAQDLDDDLLEQVRLLSNLETDAQKLIQIILLGQPELRDTIDRPNLRQLRQRITVRYHLAPLSIEDMAGYIQHRLTLAGANGYPRFERTALKRIYKYSGGVPRLVNAVCDKALLAGFVHQADVITRQLVRVAIDELEGVPA